MNKSIAFKAVLGAALAVTASAALAQAKVDFGQREFQTNCASCHGRDAKGNGPLVEFLRHSPPDLTQLQKKNAGIFPIARVYEVIEGAGLSHGSRDMPIWGQAYAIKAAEYYVDVPYNAEDYIHRIGRTGRAGASGLAVTLVSRDDARLVGDIEKLIKKKIDIEPLELDEERPPRFERPHRRPEYDAGERAEPRRGPIRPAYAGGTPPASRDPFFDQPYESSAGATPPTWERSPAVPIARGLSPNIKPKKRVAALFGGKGAD